MIEVKYSQSEIRNLLFRWIAGLTPKSERQNLPSKVRYHVGKWFAASAYMFAILIAAICPAIYISTIIINEFYAWGWPASESWDAVGQVSEVIDL